ncbi:hypothetical protein EVAR_66303_1 [Eumeta japonica]|uniref:Uncharacterized protein n=1 Tax=Eumeta variegata TaxID=151549 RepID=A0A4C1ZCI2_EUMVA|nr:hypothetical protein EVAR_66303_1 [Eumeta japonica]
MKVKWAIEIHTHFTKRIGGSCCFRLHNWEPKASFPLASNRTATRKSVTLCKTFRRLLYRDTAYRVVSTPSGLALKGDGRRIVLSASKSTIEIERETRLNLHVARRFLNASQNVSENDVTLRCIGGNMTTFKNALVDRRPNVSKKIDALSYKIHRRWDDARACRGPV